MPVQAECSAGTDHAAACSLTAPAKYMPGVFPCSAWPHPTPAAAADTCSREQGCELCATAEDVWLEAARLQPPDMAKAVLARGVAAIPTSVKIWMQVRLLAILRLQRLPAVAD